MRSRSPDRCVPVGARARPTDHSSGSRSASQNLGQTESAHLPRTRPTHPPGGGCSGRLIIPVQNSPSSCSSSPGSMPGSASGASGASLVLGRGWICTVAGVEGACASDGGAGATSVTLTSGDETARTSTTPTRLMPASRRATANASARAPRSAGTRLRPPESAPFPPRRMSGPSTAVRRRLSWGCPASGGASPPISVGARGRSYGRDFRRVRGGRPSCQQTGSEVAASGSSALRVPRLAVAGRPARRRLSAPKQRRWRPSTSAQPAPRLGQKCRRASAALAADRDAAET